MTKQRFLAAIAAILALAIPNLAAALPGYLTDSSGTIVRNNFGECWHTSQWTPELAVVGCDGKVAEPVAEPAPPPPPPPPPPPKVEQTTLGADTFFEFDRSNLSPEAVAVLDEFVSRLGAYDEMGTVQITGHADRIGSEAYNVDLSLRRAQSVEQYLIDRGAVSPDNIQVRGLGESQPRVMCDEMPRAALIECLAPNRRADIQVDVKRVR
jgi:OOP family OmpA-OmpF porin